MRVGGGQVPHLEGGAGGEGTRLEAPLHPGAQARQGVEGARPDHEAAHALGGDDVGGVASLGDDAVHLVAGLQLLAQQADRHLGHDHGIGGVDPLMRGRRGVRGAPDEAHLHVVDGEALGRQPVLRPRVHHHRRVGAVEGPPLEQHELAAPAFLGRRAEHGDAEPEIIGDTGEAGTRPDGGGRDQVVPAGVAHRRQGVVLGADDDRHRARPGPGAHCGGKPVGAALDVEAARIEGGGHVLSGSLLLEAELRLVVDGPAERHQLRASPVDGLADLSLRRGRVGASHARAPGVMVWPYPVTR